MKNEELYRKELEDKVEEYHNKPIWWNDENISNRSKLSNNISDELIKKVEMELKKQLPKSYIDLLKEQNGGRLIKRYYYLERYHDEIVFEVDEIEGISEEFTRGLLYLNRVDIEYINLSNVVIFAKDYSGHAYYLFDYNELNDKNEPKIVYYDEELEKRILLSNSFEEFINNLKIHEEVDLIYMKAKSTSVKNEETSKNQCRTYVTREIVNLAEITLVANLFIKKDKLVDEIVHDFGQYNYRFMFLDFEKTTIKEWVETLKAKDAEDIYIDFDSNIDICKVSSFAPVGLVCKYKDGTVTCWYKSWKYDFDNKKFYVTYQERETKKERYNNEFVDRFESNFQYFKNSIKQVEKIAKILDLPYWEEYFKRTLELEDADKAKKHPAVCGLHNTIPSENLPVYAMAIQAFPFGGIGAWNDEAFNKAISHEMKNQFIKYSQNLFAELMGMLRYVTNNVQLESESIDLNKIQNEKSENKLIGYSQEMEGYPTFKFYFPENLGELSKVQNNIFELRKNDKQIIRVMVSKCTSEEKLEELANNWIEKTRTTNKQEIKSFIKENIGNQKVYSYILGGVNQQDKIYKIVYKANCWITISGVLKDNKEEIITDAIAKIEIVENKDVQDSKNIAVDCPACNNSFELKWNVPATEKTFYCKCPNCGMELKRGNPNYKG